MSGSLNANIVQLFKIQFEQNCINLLLESYNQSLVNTGFSELSENNITAHLVGLMKANPVRNELQISIHREAYNDTDDTYTGEIDADRSPRIDIKYSVWNSSTEYEYFIEAKNLAENTWTRKVSNISVDANRLQRRYVETGIDNFINGRYPYGCLVGYVLEGDPGNIVDKINTILTNSDRNTEHLALTSLDNFQHCYSSTHSSHNFSLKHFLLKYTP